MARLTETEIFDCLVTNFREAAEHCDNLAKLPAQGPTYTKLRENLRLIEGAARQAAGWRDDARWLKVGMDAARCHQVCGDWIRAHAARKLFLTLGTAMRKLQRHTEGLQHKATGRRGTILPIIKPGPHRDTRPVQVSTSGLILPATMH